MPSVMLVDGTDLAAWANRRDAQEVLPQLLRRLVHATVGRMWCPSCIYFYDEVQEFAWPFPVRHATEFLVSRLPALEFSHRVDGRVALHYHSQSESRRREGAAAQRLLEAVPGLTYVPIEPEPRLGRLCTSAVQAELGQAVWAGVIRDEIDRACAGGAAILATIYDGCQRLSCGFEAEGRIVIEHYLFVFARGLGIIFEDRYKKYRLWQDPERVLADMAPCQQANRVDPSRARELVAKTFGRATPAPDWGNAPAS